MYKPVELALTHRPACEMDLAKWGRGHWIGLRVMNRMVFVMLPFCMITSLAYRIFIHNYRSHDFVTMGDEWRLSITLTIGRCYSVLQ